MSVVTLRPRDYALGPLGRALGLAATLGVATTGLGGCDSNQYVLFSLQNLPPTGTVSVHATYTLDSIQGKVGVARITPPVDQFVISLPGEARGKLTANIHAYTYVSPTECYKTDATSSLMLDGSHKQELPTMMPVGKPSCDATQAVADFPPAPTEPLASWGTSAANIWVVGAQGAVRHWDGATFTQIALPGDLTGNPPTWRAVGGSLNSPIVWMAGDGGVVAYWDGSQLQTVKLTAFGGGPTTATPNWVSLAVAYESMAQTSEGVFFVSKDGYIGVKIVSQDVLWTFNQPDTYPVYPIGSAVGKMSASVSFSDIYCIAQNECWFVGSDPQAFASSGQSGAGVIFQEFTGNTILFSDYSMNSETPTLPLVRDRLRGVWGKFTASRQLYAVGDNASALFSGNSMTSVAMTDPNFFPRFQTDYSALAATTLQGHSLQLNAINGTSPSDLWIVGNAGVLMRWAPTPALPDNPFSVIPTGVTANLTSVFSTGPDDTIGLYVSGDQQTFLSPWITPK